MGSGLSKIGCPILVDALMGLLGVAMDNLRLFVLYGETLRFDIEQLFLVDFSINNWKQLLHGKNLLSYGQETTMICQWEALFPHHCHGNHVFPIIVLGKMLVLGMMPST